MSNLLIWKRNITVVVLLLCTVSLVAQSKYKETFKVNDDVIVEVNTSYTNVIFETWNKNVVEVEAFVDDENLSKEEKEEIFKDWDLDVLGNSKKVVIKSKSGSLWGDALTLNKLDHVIKLEKLEELSDLAELKKLESLKKLEQLDLEKIDLAIKIPEIPDFKECPKWPFGDGEHVVISGIGNKAYFFGGEMNGFDMDTYKQDKKKYVEKLNKKYDTKVTVAEVDKWLQETEAWREEFSDVMKNWGEKFGKEFEDKFGPEFEVKMEKWGKEYEKKMQEWSEKFNEEMETKTQKIILDVEKLTDKYEDAEEKRYRVMTIPSDSEEIIMKIEEGHKSIHAKAKKTIIIKMPKGTKTDINVRHGEVKMADAYNIKANLNYSSLSANSIDGGKTLINVSYAPVEINNWNQGELFVNYVDNCRINTATHIELKSNSSDVSFNTISKTAKLSGSYGNLIINTISDDFMNIDISLENADAKIKLPKTDFLFDFVGKKTPVSYPSAVNFTHNKKEGKVYVSGFNKDRSSNKKIMIDAVYSNVKLQ